MRWGSNTRISRDPEGMRLGVERQREDLEGEAVRAGLRVVDRYEDNDISASTRSRKRRPEYERMLVDAAAGRLGVILAYTSSRLTRRPRENEDLIELAERYGVEFRYLRSPSFDLNTADGRNIARILAANDAAESERISERVARAVAARAEAGTLHGGSAPSGYEYVKDPAGRVAAVRAHPEHAAWLAEAANRVLAGETLHGICTEWHRSGRRTARDSQWLPRTLKRALLAPAVIGMREYAGELHVASWEPVMDRKVWDRLHVLLDDPGRRSVPGRTRDNRRKHALSGLLACKLCGRRLGSMTDSKAGPVAFHCSTLAMGGCGKVRISMHLIEPWVRAAFLESFDGMTVTCPGRRPRGRPGGGGPFGDPGRRARVGADRRRPLRRDPRPARVDASAPPDRRADRADPRPAGRPHRPVVPGAPARPGRARPVMGHQGQRVEAVDVLRPDRPGRDRRVPRRDAPQPVPPPRGERRRTRRTPRRARRPGPHQARNHPLARLTIPTGSTGRRRDV